MVRTLPPLAVATVGREEPSPVSQPGVPSARPACSVTERAARWLSSKRAETSHAPPVEQVAQRPCRDQTHKPQGPPALRLGALSGGLGDSGLVWVQLTTSPPADFQLLIPPARSYTEVKPSWTIADIATFDRLAARQ